jgi:hypothetical protein
MQTHEWRFKIESLYLRDQKVGCVPHGEGFCDDLKEIALATREDTMI